jgi:chromosomal replication initiator protein
VPRYLAAANVPHAPLAQPWNAIRNELRGAVSEAAWHGWLAGLEPREIIGDTLIVEASDRVRPYVADRFGRLLQACAASVLGPDMQVDLVGPGATLAATQRGPAPARPSLNPRLTFEQFVIGDANRLAHAAALAVAELPGLAYNPLFICGAPGLGKTHLLHSIANYVTAYGDGLAVRYTTAEAFTNAFIGARDDRTAMEAFKSLHRGVDVLLVDDVQFLQQKVRTEEEFFHTFNALHAVGAQVVLTSDQPPRDLARLEERLRARFECGLVTELGPPDAATRLTILRKRIAQDGIGPVNEEALDLIAMRVQDSVRALEGALIRVVAFASLTGRELTADLAGEVLGTLYPAPSARSRRRTVEEIQAHTCDAFGVSLDELRSPSRAAQVASARQVAMYLSRELTDATLPAIGKAFGRNHTTVMHACKRTAERISSDREAYEAVRALTLELGGDVRAD